MTAPRVTEIEAEAAIAWWKDKVRLGEPDIARTLRDLLSERAALEAKLAEAAPHYCTMDHAPIRHWDSGDDERCPLCRAVDALAAKGAEIERLEERIAQLGDGWGLPRG